jgi:hypothetical protein
VEVPSIQFIPSAQTSIFATDRRCMAVRGQIRSVAGVTSQNGRLLGDLRKNGGDLTRRFARIAAAVLGQPVKSYIVAMAN